MLRHNMNRKHLFLALALGIVLVLLCASAALAADRPIKVSMELSKYKLSGPETVTVSITVTNVGDGDMPGPVTLYYPDGSKVEDFGSPTLSVGKSKRWNGDWAVTQEQLDEGKVAFTVKYSAYDGPIGDDGEPTLKSHKVNYTKNITNLGKDPQITVNRTIVPTTAQKDQEISVTYEITNSGDVEVTSVNIKENAAVSAKSGTINSIAVGATETYTFTTTMGKKDITSSATISYKAGGKNYTKKVDATTIKYGEVKLNATLKADKKGGAPGDTVKLTLTLKNSGTLDFTNITVTDPALGTVFEGLEVKAGKTETFEKDVTVTETQDLQFTVKADESTGKGVETATGRIKITAMDPTQVIALRVEASADRDTIYKRPGEVRFFVTVHNDSAVEVKNVNVRAGETTLYSFSSIPVGQSASFVRDVNANLTDKMRSGTFRFVASCRDQLDQTLQFESNDVVINYVEQTPVPEEPPLVTPPKPASEPMPTDQPEPEWLGQAETIADGAKWIFAAVAGILLILLLIGAVRRGKSRSESRKAMDHLEGANYRDYSAVPKRGQRSEISNGGTAEDKPAAEEDKPEVKEEVENTVQSSELMAETLRRLYSDKTEEAAEAVTETVEEKAEAAAEAVETAAADAAETVKEEVKSAAEEAGGARRRRGRKQE